MNKNKENKNKKKKEKKVKIRELFNQYSEVLKQAIHATGAAIIAYVENNESTKLEMIQKTIQLEKKHDRLREEITDRIFSKETMVFSREDRLNLVDDLDDIVDKAELVARKLKLVNNPLLEDFKEGFTTIGKDLQAIGAEMHLLVTAILKDFSKGKDHITKITDIRRNIRELHWGLLEQTYTIKTEFQTFYFYNKLIKAMCHLADEVEEVADELYALICKYSL